MNDRLQDDRRLHRIGDQAVGLGLFDQLLRLLDIGVRLERDRQFEGDGSTNRGRESLLRAHTVRNLAILQQLMNGV